MILHEEVYWLLCKTRQDDIHNLLWKWYANTNNNLYCTDSALININRQNKKRLSVGITHMELAERPQKFHAILVTQHSES